MNVGIKVYSEELDCFVVIQADESALIDYGGDEFNDMAVRLRIEPEQRSDEYSLHMSVDLREADLRDLITALTMCIASIRKANTAA
jgi:hypothetical protein